MPDQRASTMANDWLCETLRFTAFPKDPVTITNAPAWWRTVARSDPKSETTRHSESTSAVIGEFSGNALRLMVQPRRVDWLLEPTGAGPDSSPRVGRVADVLPGFVEAVSRWLGIGLDWNRLALAGIIFKGIPDEGAAVPLLRRYVPLIRSDNLGVMTDFSIGLNLQRTSKSKPPLRINRLSKWTTTAWRRVSMPVPMATGLVPIEPVGPIIPGSLSVQAELDMNTDPDSGEIRAADALTLVAELHELFDEICLAGSVP